MVKQNDYRDIDCKTPFWRIRGKLGGPRLLVYSCVHGNEHVSSQVAYEMVEKFKKQPDLRGEITLLPAVNLPRFVLGTRANPLDNKNINNVSPTSRNERLTVSQELAPTPGHRRGS